ncbi:MAG: FAD:protein FMN transferase [Phycisphaerae bacterium]|nr:FAD:protein FMN transferase [Phycisphaerae bacterium]
MTNSERTFAWATIEPVPGLRAHRFSHRAMNTIFEVIVGGQEAQYAEQAAWAAFDELDQIETELSRFIEGSDIWQINSLHAGESVTVGIAAFECLQLARRICDETSGAFDVTACGANRGMDLVLIDENEFTVTVKADGVTVDLGGIGKGYAVDRMAALLAEWEIHCAIVHSGQSSVWAIGSPPETQGWVIALGGPAAPGALREKLVLSNRALSGSAQTTEDRHIIARNGKPVAAAVAAWAIAPSAAVADALSTAFVVMSDQQVRQYCDDHEDCDYRRQEA